MKFFVSQISVAEAATIINVIITFIQHSLSLSLAALLIFLMPRINSASTWSEIARTLHSSLWPTVLGFDFRESEAAGATVSTFARLATISAILIPITGGILPLGLYVGPILQSNYQMMASRYVPDGSVLGVATTPNRHEFRHGRVCGSDQPLPCPDNGDGQYNIAYAPSIIEVFNSTPYGPFSMQYRCFYNGGSQQNISAGIFGTSQTFILRNDMFVVEGLIVDMSLDHPGIGFWNQTMPDLMEGGTWSQDILWLEPITECMNTNLTIDYHSGPSDITVKRCNLTDRGGLFALTNDPPRLNLHSDGQHLNLAQHAYKGAAYANLYAMGFLNTTRESSFNGISYPVPIFFCQIGASTTALRAGTLGLSYANVSQEMPLNLTNSTTHQLDLQYYPLFPVGPGTAGLPLGFVASAVADHPRVICEGWGGADIANITNTYVACAHFFGFPTRMGDGDLRAFKADFTWRQEIHVCTSATRASIQRVTFSANDTSRLDDLRLSRRPISSKVLWAVEKANMKIQDIDLLWGLVDDRFENDPSLWTIRSDHLYLPAGSAAKPSFEFALGHPSTAHSAVWESVYNLGGPTYTLMDYTGQADHSVQIKFESLMKQNPNTGLAQIRNAIWTDIMANSVVGTHTNKTLLVSRYQKSLGYDFRYAIPGFILLALWAPAFFIPITLLMRRALTFGYMQKVLDHTSVGWVAVGRSALRLHCESAEGQYVTESDPNANATSSTGSLSHDVIASGEETGYRRHQWTARIAATPVMLDLGQKGENNSE